jgi:COMPASS component BRE2
MSRVTPFGEPFRTGDVIGLYISLPPDGNEKSFFKHRRLRRSFNFKGQLYFESVDYSPTKRYIEMAEYEATPIKTNIDKPIPPPTISGSKIIVYKNGVCQGVMWQDLLSILPIEQNAKEKDQLRFDDGTLGYYPVISVYRNGTATANFGPDFKYPPSKDPEAEAENRRITAEQNVWRPMSERWEEKLIEECLIDLLDEVELWVSEQAVLERSMEASASSQAGRIAGQTRLQEYDQSEDDYRRSQGRSRASEDRDLDDADRDIDMGTPVEREMTEDRIDDADDDEQRGGDRDHHRDRQGHRQSHHHHHRDDDYSGDDRSQQDVEMHPRYDDDDEYNSRRGDRDDRRHSGHHSSHHSRGHRDDEASDDDDRHYA